MSRHFEVIGRDVMGYAAPMGRVIGHDIDDEGVSGVDVMGYSGPMGQVVGYDEEGYPIVVGAGPARRKRGQNMIQVNRPAWRDSQLAPGVIAPDQGLLPLPMGNFTFVLATQLTTFTGQLQKPFRGERLLVTTVRTGASAIGRLLGQIFVGTDLAQLDITALDLEQVGAANAFGVRLTMKPAQPGVQIRIPTTLSAALAGADTIFTSVQLLGRLIH